MGSKSKQNTNIVVNIRKEAVVSLNNEADNLLLNLYSILISRPDESLCLPVMLPNIKCISERVTFHVKASKCVNP